MDHVVEFYKLFGPNLECSLTLSSSFWPAEMQVSERDREDLSRRFSLEDSGSSIGNERGFGTWTK